MSKRPKHTRTLCKGCKHGIEHHPSRGACRYGHALADGGTACGPAGEGAPAGGCRCPAFNTPASKVPDSPPFVFTEATAEEARKRVPVGTVKSVNRDGTVSVLLGADDLGAHLIHAAELLLGALRGFIEAFKDVRSRGGVVSTSSPPVDAVRSRGRARRKEVDDAAPSVTAPEKLSAPASVSTPTPAPPQGEPYDPASHPDNHATSEDLSTGARAILRAIALSEDGCSDGRLSLETGYKATSRKTYLQQLRSRVLITKDGARHVLTAAGRNATLNIMRRKAGELREALPVGERTMLDAIAAAGADGATDARLAVVTHYKPTSRKTYLAALVARELVEVLNGRRCLTGLGIRETAEARTPSMKPEELLEHYISTLPEGESLILQVLRDASESHTAAEIGAATAYKPTSVKTYVAKLRARSLVVTDGAGSYGLAPELVS